MKRTFRHILLVFLTIGGLFGCSRAPGNAPVHPVEAHDPAVLMEMAAALAARGESNRAEQYYVAALQAGADPKEVYPPLVETCIQAGRFGSALQHAERHLRDAPEDLRLLRLAASLSEALGHQRAANEYALQIAQLPNRGAEDELFLGAYFDRQRMSEKATEHLERYLARTSAENQEPWVRPTLKRLAQTSPQPADSLATLLPLPESTNGGQAE